ncbi:MAG: formate dehydrogenase accessory sulfurtransferase FdhD [Bacteroidetes bacterium]|nr:formate dehydrogenase accessory sulfurtransferase FdhD [Bacteroidota bacterium]
MQSSSVAPVQITKITLNGSDGDAYVSKPAEDLLAVEQPLEIKIVYGPENDRQQRNISVTMCTPGHDEELATGFLFTEGIINGKDDIMNCGAAGNTVIATLRPGISFDPQKIERHFYTSSSCGVCGKSSIDAVKNVFKNSGEADHIQISAALLTGLPDTLRKHQQVFEHTGGLHASALFDLSGNLLITREDVGRHNALDKLIGATLQEFIIKKDTENGKPLKSLVTVPLNNHILLLSGRASFELIQKAAMAGIKVVCAVGTPSSLAVELAKETDMTLIGFLRDGRFNIYCGEQRIN